MIKDKKFSFGIFFLFVVVMCTCTEEIPLSDGRFPGTWISGEQKDTLIFTSDQFFNKSDPFWGIKHIYEYSYTNVDITIQYKGPNKIYVRPTTHPYELNEDKLINDFTEGCYGFDSAILKYNRN